MRTWKVAQVYWKTKTKTCKQRKQSEVVEKSVFLDFFAHTFTQNAVANAGEHDFSLQERCFTHHRHKHVSECIYLKHPPCENDWGEEVWWIWKTVRTSWKFLAKPVDVSYFPCFKSTKPLCTVLENQGFKVWEKSKYAHITELSKALVRNTRKKNIGAWLRLRYRGLLLTFKHMLTLSLSLRRIAYCEYFIKKYTRLNNGITFSE